MSGNMRMRSDTERAVEMMLRRDVTHAKEAMPSAAAAIPYRIHVSSDIH